jgi:hypothetical protein
MGLVSGTYTTYDSKGQKESLEDKIYNISPMDTVFLSSIVRKKGTAKVEEWQTDTLAAAITTNAQLEGDDAAFTTPAATTRVGNYMQILRKTCIISDTDEAVDKAGRDSEMGLQIAKRGSEIKRDLEKNMLDNVAGDAGGVGTARKMATMGAWLKTNIDKEASGGNPTYTSGVPAAVRTDSGSPRAFTETIAKAVVSSMYTNGGTPKVLMTGPFNRAVVSSFSGVATRNFDLSNVDPQPTAIIGSADVYVSNFGTFRVLPNRFQRDRDAWFLDWNMLCLRVLRSLQTKPLGKSGDAEKRLMVWEVTLQPKNEAGLGLAADLTTS